MIESVIQSAVANLLVIFVHPGHRWFALYLLTSLLLAYGVYRLQARRDPELAGEGFLGFAFPRELWTHPSTRLDLAYFVLNKLVFASLLGSTAVLAYGVEAWGSAALAILAAPPLVEVSPGVGIAIRTVAMLLAFDFGLWLAHYLSHRVPILWEFHKVHHSVEVMTPFAAGRVHPIDDALSYVMGGLFSGLCAAGCGWLLGESAMGLNAFQAHVVLLVFYLFGFHLRHSHVWLPYTGWAGKILVSPAHHQVHHSAEERHWDRNMGFIFAIWDWMFGTLWVPAREQESFRLGIGGEEKEFSSIGKLYALPFVKIAARLKAARARRAGASAPGTPPAAAERPARVQVPAPGGALDPTRTQPLNASETSLA